MKEKKGGKSKKTKKSKKELRAALSELREERDRLLRGRTSLLRRFISYSAELASPTRSSNDVDATRDERFLEGLRILRRVITRGRREEGKSAWSTSSRTADIAPLQQFLFDAFLTEETLRELLNSTAARFPRDFDRLMSTMPADIASFLVDARALTLTDDAVLN